jgi:hypothetical protein
LGDAGREGPPPLTGGSYSPGQGTRLAPARSYPVRECLLCILNEEWEHRLYAERDLNALEARS